MGLSDLKFWRKFEVVLNAIYRFFKCFFCRLDKNVPIVKTCTVQYFLALSIQNLGVFDLFSGCRGISDGVETANMRCTGLQQEFFSHPV